MRKLLGVLVMVCGSLYAGAQQDVINGYLGELAAAKEDTARARVLSLLSRRYLYYKPDSALYYANTALRLSQKMNYERGIAQAYNDIAATMFYNGSHHRALELHLKALQLREKIKDSLGISASYVNIGIVYDEIGDFRKSIDYNKRAIEIDEALKDFEALSVDYLNIGEDYLTLNRLDSALHFTQDAYSIALKVKGGIPVLPNALHNLGVIQAKMGNSDLALAHFREALNQATLASDSKQYAEVCYEMAMLFRERKEADSAFIYSRQSMDEAVKMNYQQDILNAGLLLSSYYESMGKPDSALSYFKLAAAAKDSIFNQEKVRQVQSLTFSEQVRQQELAEEKARQEEQRRNNLQYIGIGIFIILFFLVVLLLSKIKMKQRVIDFLGLLGLMLLFEFISVLIDPWKGQFAHHIPVFLLLISVGIAALLEPVHHWLTKLMKKKLLNKDEDTITNSQ